MGKKFILTANDGFGKKGDEVELESEFHGLATVRRISDQRALSVFRGSLCEESDSLFTEPEDDGA